MPAAKLNLTIEQGTTFQQKFTLNEPGDPLVPIDISTWTLAGQIRRTHADSDVLATLTFAISNQITNKGEFIISLTATETSAIPVECATTNYVYDIEATISGAKTRLVQGYAIISAEVTR